MNEKYVFYYYIKNKNKNYKSICLLFVFVCNNLIKLS